MQGSNPLSSDLFLQALVDGAKFYLFAAVWPTRWKLGATKISCTFAPARAEYRLGPAKA